MVTLLARAVVLLALLAGSGWLGAAVLFGLWLGERGRRLDAQRREGVLPVGRVKPATITPAPDSATPANVAEDLAGARDKYVADAVAEGFNREEAEADFDRMLASIHTDTMAVTS